MLNHCAWLSANHCVNRFSFTSICMLLKCKVSLSINRIYIYDRLWILGFHTNSAWSVTARHQEPLCRLEKDLCWPFYIQKSLTLLVTILLAFKWVSPVRPGENAIFVADSSRGGQLVTYSRPATYLASLTKQAFLARGSDSCLHMLCRRLPLSHWVKCVDGGTMSFWRISHNCFNWRALCIVI